MSRPGNPYDNASCESFLRTLKREEIHANDYQDLGHLHANVEAFIQQYYNRRRLHSALGYRAPEDFFGAALSSLPGTELVLTLTNGMRQMVERNSTLRPVKAPQELRPFHFLMVWRPRLTTDARHTWLREAVRQVSPQEASGQRLSHAHN
jgi:Integrase core domain